MPFHSPKQLFAFVLISQCVAFSYWANNVLAKY